MLANEIKVVFGSTPFMASNVEDITEWLKFLTELGINVIDTAQSYGKSEELLGKVDAASTFTLDTKFSAGFGSEPTTKDLVVKSGNESLAKLATNSVDVYYIHAPDRRVPWKDTLSGLDELYQRGAFKRLGLSNFLAQEVEEIVNVAKENNFVIPSVYQGNYSAVARRADDEIFPVLRKHGIAFYAYSPIAGGFLSKSITSLTEAKGRFGNENALSRIYNGMYNQPSFLAALSVWGQIAQDEGISGGELAYRWVVYHSKLQGDHGDAVIIGARKREQLKETVEAINRGPLTEAAVKKIDQVWETVKADARLDNFELLRSQS